MMQKRLQSIFSEVEHDFSSIQGVTDLQQRLTQDCWDQQYPLCCSLLGSTDYPQQLMTGHMMTYPHSCHEKKKDFKFNFESQ